jgi:acetyl-CoA acetyltransferase
VPSRTNGLDGKVALAGVGYSQIARRTGRSEGSLAVEACKNALADAGLTIHDVDGISVWPDRISSAFEGPSIAYMHRALGMKNTRFWQAYGAGPAQLSSIVGAAYAIVAGAASTVVCFRAHLRQEQRFYVAGGTGASGKHAAGDQAFKAPYGVPAGAPRFALWAQRQAHEFGVSDG